ncbi:hypothetical protein E1B28_009426 [Marasmius oreades]|uniref:Mid2 domain-containing protein n=1 Tax=Marasmius oreades TaxID=181124 RepID=A0A9P7S0Z5_9AGAR|nr:uncharacterized protein E1B28_009426 [Marasmius oreades]KAG7093143.1 hypothetical protein E1B28_009426 [Marasmius oreades]
MRLLSLVLALTIETLQPHVSVEALNITFPTPPRAAQGSTFIWTREEHDPQQAWLRKRKLDGTPGVAPWVNDSVALDLTPGGGVDSIVFTREGLYNIGIFDKSDSPKSAPLLQPIAMVQVTVIESLNSTSTGATQTPSQTLSSTSSATAGELRAATPKPHKLSPGAIAGIAVGAAAALMLPIIMLCIRYRRARASSRLTETDPTPFIQTTSSVQGLSKEARTQNSSTPNDPIEGSNQQLAGRPETIQHQDSGWRPPLLISENDHIPIELPPTYGDSTRRARVGQTRNEGRRVDLAGNTGLTESVSSPLEASPLEKVNPNKEYYSRQ